MSQVARYYNESLKYLDGQGARKGTAETFRLNVLAADEGMHDAVLAMGWFYRNGVGVDLDIEESKRWYRKSARQKDPRAMFSLGEIFYDERDYDEALIWFQRAIDAGHARSLARHDVLERSGVQQDKVQARKLFTRAAERKVYEAQRLLRFWSYLARVKRTD